MELNYQSLKTLQREIRDGFSTPLALRTHRALSWLNRAEMETEDGDARFIFLWISFNAAYANEIPDRKLFTEQEVFHNFFQLLIDIDKEKMLYHIVWEQFPKSIRLLIDNQYVFKPFWDFHNGMIEEAEWKERFEKSKSRAHYALGHMDTVAVLSVVFERLYVLRNQLIHGGATWNSSVNRDQIRDGADFLGHLVPTIIHLMMSEPDRVWGDPVYPVVE